MSGKVRRWLIRATLGAWCTVGTTLLAPAVLRADPPPTWVAGANVDTAVMQHEAPVILMQYAGTQAQLQMGGYSPGAVAAPHATLGFEASEPAAPMPVGPAAGTVISTQPALPPGGAGISVMTNEIVAPVPAAFGQPALPPGNAAKLLPPVGAIPLSPAPAPTTLGPFVQFPRTDVGPLRKSFADLSAAPCFAHAPDYTWIVGRVEYCNTKKEWRLRYASVDESDGFGGRVTLVQNQHVQLLAEGMYIQVHGHLVNPASAGSGPIFYRIEAFESVKDPNHATTFQPK